MPLRLTERNISNKRNRLKNPNWRGDADPRSFPGFFPEKPWERGREEVDADQLATATCKHDRGVELGSTEKKTPA